MGKGKSAYSRTWCISPRNEGWMTGLGLPQNRDLGNNLPVEQNAHRSGVQRQLRCGQ